MEFERWKYYSQSEAIKTFKISRKRFKELIKDLTIVSTDVVMYTQDGKPYDVTTIYIKKIDFYKKINQI